MLSICIPTLNRSKLLKKSLDVLLAFKEIDIEVNISNNGSDDNTLEVIKEYEHKFDKFNYVSLDNTIEANFNADSVIQLATQKYIFIIADDDTCLESGLLEAIDFLEKNQNVIAFYGGYKEYTLKEKFLVDTKKCDSIEIYSNQKRIELINKHWSLEVPVFRNSFYKKNILVHTNAHQLSWSFVDKALSKGNIVVSPSLLFKHYIHPNRMTETFATDGSFNFRCLSEVEIFLANAPVPQAAKTDALFNMMAQQYNFHVAVCLRNNDPIQARFFITKGAMYNSTHFSNIATNWDQNQLVKATTQEIKNRIYTKSYIERVFIISYNDKENAFFDKLFGELQVDAVFRVGALDDIPDYHDDKDYVLYFDELKSLANIHLKNTASFKRVMDSLKFTSGEINLVL